MIFGILIGIGLTLLIFSIIFIFLTKRYKEQEYRLLKFCKPFIKTTIKEVSTRGWEERGLKNNFPSMMGSTFSSLHFSDEFVVVTCKWKLLFLINSTMQPFVLTINEDKFKQKMNFDRVYRPIKVDIFNGQDYDVRFNAKTFVGTLRMHIVFQNVSKQQEISFGAVKNWC